MGSFFIRLPYYTGDLSRDPNLENHPYVVVYGLGLIISIGSFCPKGQALKGPPRSRRNSGRCAFLFLRSSKLMPTLRRFWSGFFGHFFSKKAWRSRGITIRTWPEQDCGENVIVVEKCAVPQCGGNSVLASAPNCFMWTVVDRGTRFTLPQCHCRGQTWNAAS